MKNLSLPKLSEEQIKENKLNSQKLNAVRVNPLRGKGKEKPEKSKKNSKVEVYKKKKISQALREQVWLARFGRVFEHKCYVTWCKNVITVFDFESGHNIPESKGGKTDLTNLFPICRKCNGSMGDRYSIDEWNALHTPIPEGREENLGTKDLGGKKNSVVGCEEKSQSTRNLSVEVGEKSPIRRKGWRRFFFCFT